MTRRALLMLLFPQSKPEVTYVGVVTYIEAEEKATYVTLALHDRLGNFEGNLTVVCDRSHPAMAWLIARKGKDVAGVWTDV